MGSITTNDAFSDDVTGTCSAIAMLAKKTSSGKNNFDITDVGQPVGNDCASTQWAANSITAIFTETFKMHVKRNQSLPECGLAMQAKSTKP